MSVSTLFDKNDFHIYVNNITLKNLNLSGDGNYKLKFPEDLPINNLSLSILAVDTIDNNIITLKWLQPSESLPFDVINCNILNAQLEINCLGNTTLGYLDAEIVNARKIGGTEVSGFLVSPLQVETDIGYFLPPTRPTTNGQVLSSLINGTMSWVTPSIPPNLSGYRKKFIDINTLLTSASPTHFISYIPSFSLNIGTTYKVTSTFSFRKESGTVFSLYSRIIPLSGANIITTAMGTNSTAIVDISNFPPNNTQNFQHTFWFSVYNSNTSWEIQVESGAQSGGQVRWDIVEIVFEPSITLITD